MITPDNNKFTPVRKDSAVNAADDSGRRKAPDGDFEKVAKEVDERDKGGTDDDFFLTKDKKKLTGGTGKTTLQEEDTPLLSPFQLARGHRDNEDSPKGSLKDLYEDSVDAPKPKKVEPKFIAPDNPISQGPVIPFETKLTTPTSRYSSVEQPDLAEVNTIGGNQQQPAYIPPVFPIDTSMTTEAPATVKTPAPLQSIQEVIDLIVEKVYTVKQTGDTQVIVDLKGSFAGSHLIVTESDSAKGQLNITIDNLTGPNQALIEAHKAKIMDTLLESGVQVQRFTASTALETSRIDVATDDTRERSGRGNPQEDNPRDGKRQKSNDKT